MGRLVVGAMMILCISATGHGLAEQPPPGPAHDDQQKLGRFCLAGLWDGRERLRSGIFRATARKTRRGSSANGESSYFVAFDLDSDCLRFDGPSAKYARNRSESLFAMSKIVTRRAPDWKVDIHHARPFDVRVVGLVVLVGFEYRNSYDLVRNSLEKRELPQVKAPDGGSVYELTWDYVEEGLGERFRRIFWLDAEQGFSPVRMEFHDVYRGSDGSPVDRLLASSETTWVEASGVWVPESWILLAHQNQRRLEMTFTWESVNQTVPERLFQIEGLDLAEGTTIVNHRLGTPVVESYVGMERVEKAASGPPEARARWRGPIIGISLVLLVAVAVLVWRRVRVARAGG